MKRLSVPAAEIAILGLTVGEEGEIVIEPKMKEWLESIERTAEGDA